MCADRKYKKLRIDWNACLTTKIEAVKMYFLRPFDPVCVGFTVLKTCIFRLQIGPIYGLG